MAGVLQDKLYIERLNESISQAEKTEIGKYAPFFSLPNVKGEKISRTSENLKKKNLLINFWASWVIVLPIKTAMPNCGKSTKNTKRINI